MFISGFHLLHEKKAVIIIKFGCHRQKKNPLLVMSFGQFNIASIILDYSRAKIIQSNDI